MGYIVVGISLPSIILSTNFYICSSDHNATTSLWIFVNELVVKHLKGLNTIKCEIM